MSRLTWSMLVIAGGVMLGAAGTIWTLDTGPALEARVVTAAAALWQARGASIAAMCMLLATLVELALRRRPLAITDGEEARVLGVIVGIALFSTAAILTSYAIDAEVIGIGILGGALALAASMAVRKPSTAYSALILVAAVAIFEVPRELGWFDVTWASTETETNQTRHDDRHCIDGWIHKGELQAIGHLEGNIGELVFDDTRARAGNALVVRFGGEADVSWLACMVPIYKSLSIDTTLSFAYDVEACGGSGTIDLHIATTVTGIASCYALRHQLAGQIRKELADVAQGIGHY